MYEELYAPLPDKAAYLERIGLAGAAPVDQLMTNGATVGFKGLFGNIHEIKGMSGNLSISSLYQASSQVVELLRADDNEAAAKLFAEMEKAYDTAVAAIKAQSAGE